MRRSAIGYSFAGILAGLAFCGMCAEPIGDWAYLRD
jgi:hypothetical protein